MCLCQQGTLREIMCLCQHGTLKHKVFSWFDIQISHKLKKLKKDVYYTCYLTTLGKWFYYIVLVRV